MPRAGDWNLHIRDFQRREWFRCPYGPLLLDTARMVTSESWEEAHAGGAQEGGGFLLQNAIDDVL